MIILIYVGVFFLGFITYNMFKTDDEAIFQKVINSQGYTIKHIGKPEPLEFFIKPEWIAFNSGEEKKENKKLMERNNTTILLDMVINRENDIHFNFHPTFNMNQKGGEFMYIDMINDDGTFTSNTSPIDFALYDKNRNEIIIGAIGSGPESDFSFEIDKENQEQIREGFYVRYSGFHLYKYTKN